MIESGRRRKKFYSYSFFLSLLMAIHKQNIERDSVNGVNTIFSNTLFENKLPILFMKKSPNIIHRAIFIIVRLIRNFK